MCDVPCIGDDDHNISPGLNICMDWILDAGPAMFLSRSAGADKSLPSNIVGAFCVSFIYFATSVNEFIFLFLESSLQILFIFSRGEICGGM